ncbi:MAG: hypothetical protein RL398_3558 [Planctomycetota bacterium]|jgi:hypothetical protein
MSFRSEQGQPEPTDFREAMAQLHLALRTEVKRNSSLPSTMFDACDPTLETHLASTAESVLLSLLGGMVPADEEHPSDPAALEPRSEQITNDELRRLPDLIAGPAPAVLGIEQGLDDEYLAILTELCSSAKGVHLARAMELLQRDFGDRAFAKPAGSPGDRA